MIIRAISKVKRALLRGIEKAVPHNPCSIAGRASLFADGTERSAREGSFPRAKSGRELSWS